MLLIFFSSVLDHHHDLSISSTKLFASFLFFFFVSICLYLNIHYVHLIGKQKLETNDDDDDDGDNKNNADNDKIINKFTLFKCPIGNILFFLALSQLNKKQEKKKISIPLRELNNKNNYCFRTI